ncbi:MAG: ABC transporter ATP-binding protein, partial [Oscillospiraceae bacterium]
IAFAIATSTKPDILIADEILSVGDYAFQEKCEHRMKELMEGGTTVILVSHSTDQVKRLCNKATWIEKGVGVMSGDAQAVCNAYSAKY